MDHKKMSSKGGKRTYKLYGGSHFSDMGKKSAAIRLQEKGTDYFKQLSAKGVEARRKKAQSKKTFIEKVADVVASI